MDLLGFHSLVKLVGVLFHLIVPKMETSLSFLHLMLELTQKETSVKLQEMDKKLPLAHAEQQLEPTNN